MSDLREILALKETMRQHDPLIMIEAFALRVCEGALALIDDEPDADRALDVMFATVIESLKDIRESYRAEFKARYELERFTASVMADLDQL